MSCFILNDSNLEKYVFKKDLPSAFLEKINIRLDFYFIFMKIKLLYLDNIYIKYMELIANIKLNNYDLILRMNKL